MLFVVIDDSLPRSVDGEDQGNITSLAISASADTGLDESAHAAVRAELLAAECTAPEYAF